MSEDKPCPFCGNSTTQTHVDDGCHWVSCPKCCATGPTEFLRGGEDSPGWNTRPELDSQCLRADTAEAALDNYIKQAVLDTAHRQWLLAAAEQRIAERDELIADVLKAFNLDVEGRGSCTNPGIAFIRPWADRVAALNPNPEAESHE